ncbi:MAG: ROK family transcriptional regulator [Synergistaceae bacterium]|nr:ROK family transcriptional regulator [Synergistaceae bacterium]
MRIRSINAEKMGLSNRLTLLNLIRTTPGVSRRELARLAGLDPSTVTKIIASLLEKGLVIEHGVRDADHPGRKSIMLRVYRSAAVALIAEIGVERTRIAKGFLDASFEVLDEFDTPLDEDAFFSAFAGNLRTKAFSFPHAEYCALSVAVPGMVEWGSNVLRSLPHMGWKNVDFEARLGEFLPEMDLPVFTANEAKLSLIAEMFRNGGVSRLHSGVYVYLSQGVGGAILMGDKIIHGLSNTAGEIGHMTVDPSGPLCHCGNRGCFETFVSIDTVVRNFENLGGSLPGSDFRGKFRALLRLFQEGNDGARRVLDEMGEFLATGIANLVSILNPDFIMLGGMGSILPSSFVADVGDAVAKKTPVAISPDFLLTTASLGIESAALEGATLMAMNHYVKKAVQ